MTRRLRGDVYRLAVVAIAAAAALLRAPASGGGWEPLAGLLLVPIGVAALQFPIKHSLVTKLSGGDAVFFAIALLFPPNQAALLAAAIMAGSSMVSALRKSLRDGQPPPSRVFVPTMLFNVAQVFLAESVAAAILAAAGVSARGSLGEPRGWAAIVLAGLAFHFVNTLSVTVAASLYNGRNPLRAFLSARRAVTLQLAVLYPVGVLVAVGIVHHPVAALASVAPLALVYVWLKRSLQLSAGTLLAVQRMAEKVDLRDPYTAGHSRRVAEYCVALARAAGCAPEEVNSIRLAALVHDLGKIGIPDEILLKPGRLTEEERRVMETHPKAGYDLLAGFPEYTGLRDLVLTHHERYDGRGYPNGIEGRRLPVLSQIMPVADTIDAMTTARPYRAALSMETALAELRRGAGSQWNPSIVEAAVRLYGPRTAKAPAGIALPA